jgi:hypothetical protein
MKNLRYILCVFFVNNFLSLLLRVKFKNCLSSLLYVFKYVCKRHQKSEIGRQNIEINDFIVKVKRRGSGVFRDQVNHKHGRNYADSSVRTLCHTIHNFDQLFVAQ